MLFLSRGKSPSLLMIPGFEEIVETIHGNIPRVKRPVWLKFQALAEGFYAPGLPTKQSDDGREGKANGILDSAQYAEKLGMEEAEINSFLFAHGSYGVEFIGIDVDGQEMDVEEAVFKPEGEDGGWYCTVCDKHFSSVQGKTGHKTAAAHKDAVKAHMLAQRRKLQS